MKQTRLNAIITFWNPQKGYGFGEDEGGWLHFFHVSDQTIPWVVRGEVLHRVRGYGDKDLVNPQIGQIVTFCPGLPFQRKGKYPPALEWCIQDEEELALLAYQCDLIDRNEAMLRAQQEAEVRRLERQVKLAAMPGAVEMAMDVVRRQMITDGYKGSPACVHRTPTSRRRRSHREPPPPINWAALDSKR